MRTDSSCSRGRSAALACRIVICVPACRRNSSRLPPNAAASACRRCLAAYISARRRPSAVSTGGLKSGHCGACTASSGVSTSTSGSAAATSARSIMSSSTNASASVARSSSAAIARTDAALLSQPHRAAANCAPVAACTYPAASGGFRLASACRMPRPDSSRSTAASSGSAGGGCAGDSR